MDWDFKEKSLRNIPKKQLCVTKNYTRSFCALIVTGNNFFNIVPVVIKEQKLL